MAREQTKVIQIVAVQGVWAVYRGVDAAKLEAEERSPVQLAALFADGEVGFLEAASDGVFEEPRDASNFVRFEFDRTADTANN